MKACLGYAIYAVFLTEIRDEMGQVNITAYLQHNNIMSFLTRVHVRDKAAVEFKEFSL